MKIASVVSLFLIFSIFCGCASTPKQSEIIELSTPSHTTITIPVSTQPAPTATFTPTITPTPTLSPSLTFTPMQSLQPTFTPQEREAYLLDYFQNNTDCRLPCWLGAIPGSTSFAGYDAFLQWLGVKHRPVIFNPNALVGQKITLGGLDFDSKQVLNDIALIVEPNGMISEIEGVLHAYLSPQSFAEVWSGMDIGQVLIKYGTPNTISVKLDYNDAAGRVGYVIALYYLDQGFAVYYNGGADYQEVTRICPSLTDFQLITIGFSLQVPPFQEKGNYDTTYLTDFDTGLSVDELFALFTSTDKACLLISANDLK